VGGVAFERVEVDERINAKGEVERPLAEVQPSNVVAARDCRLTPRQPRPGMFSACPPTSMIPRETGQLRTDIANVDISLEMIMAQIARLPTRLGARLFSGHSADQR
jgi:hypothetical protein